MPQPKPWVDEIVEALEELGGVAAYKDLYAKIKERDNMDFIANRNWTAAVRQNIEFHSSDSEVFRKEDLFYSVEGVGKGVWGLRSFVKDTPSPSDNILLLKNHEVETTRETKRFEQKIYRYLRDTKLIRELKSSYRDECQVCGTQLLTASKETYSEGHHIKPLSHGGSDVKQNILILCPNHHAEFDYGSIALDPNNLVIIHKDLDNPFVGKKLFTNHALDAKNLDYHLTEIFRKHDS